MSDLTFTVHPANPLAKLVETLCEAYGYEFVLSHMCPPEQVIVYDPAYMWTGAAWIEEEE